MSIDLTIFLGVLVLVAVITFLTSYRKRAWIGLLAAAVIILGYILYRKDGLASYGWAFPAVWWKTLAWAGGVGFLLAVLFSMLIDPFIDRSLDLPLYAPRLDPLRGNWKRLLLLLASGWFFSAVLGEGIFRGFLILGIERLITNQGVFAAIALLVSALVYAASHWHEGQNGVLRRVVLGLIMGDIFIWSGYNLWLPLLAHVVFETTNLLLVYFNGDKRLKSLVWKEKSNGRRKLSNKKDR
jgi:membrane protease YdiL (CAAX protease family)